MRNSEKSCQFGKYVFVFDTLIISITMELGQRDYVIRETGMAPVFLRSPLKFQTIKGGGIREVMAIAQLLRISELLNVDEADATYLKTLIRHVDLRIKTDLIRQRNGYPVKATHLTNYIVDR